MELLVIFGPLAVGKMTVGQAVSQKTGFRLFHNHMTLDPLLPIFDWGSKGLVTLVTEFRFRVMQEAAKSELPGLIHTFVWAFEDDSDKNFMKEVIKAVEAEKGRVSFVELQAPLSERKKRGISENRAKHKPGNVERVHEMEAFEEPHQLSSNGKFPFPERYLFLENSGLSADEAAEKIIEHFGFKKI